MNPQKTSPEASKRSNPSLEAIALGAILLAAVALRVYKLGYWGLEGDELNTLRDSLTTSSLTGAKPLLFFLNYYLLASWTTLDEVSLRVFPAVFGILSVAAVYWFARRTISSTTAIIASALVAFAPAQLYWSQYARYYSLAYFLTVISAFACYLAICNHATRWYLVALVSLALAWLAHPSTAFVAAALTAWVLWQFGSEEDHRFGTRTRLLLVVLVVALAALLFWMPMLLAWHHHGDKWGYDWIHLTLGHIDAVSSGVFICGLAGMLCLWTTGQSRLATMMAAIAFIPLVLALVLSNWVAVTQGYLFVSTFVFPISAAYLIDRLACNAHGRSLGRLAAAVLLALLLTETAPKVWSQYCDGGRADFRAASQFVRDHVGEQDSVLADQPRTVKYYLEDAPVSGFRRVPADLARMWRELNDRNPRAKLWIVAEFRRRGGFNDQDLGPVTDWVNANGRLAASFSHSRLDYKHNEVRVYLVAPTAKEPSI